MQKFFKIQSSYHKGLGEGIKRVVIAVRALNLAYVMQTQFSSQVSCSCVFERERERENRRKEERKKKISLCPWKAIYNETITNNYLF